ncbi:MAG: LON peptidase substrate-binding domain-containing protein [Halioglobus sp.]
MTTISLFPLSGVLLPYGKMPLQIFEQRYLDLVRSSMKSGDPFGIVWIRRGSEVAERGRASSELGDWGTLARIVDWDQLPNGLLGVTIQGKGRFDLYETETQSSGLVLGEVAYRSEPAPASMKAEWQPMLDVLQSLESHPHVQRMGLQLDYANAWQVAWALIQLLPLEEYLKYELLGLDAIEEVMSELDLILNQISGED